MNHRNAIVLIFAALVTRELFLLFPEDPALLSPYPFSDVQISIQSYAYFMFYYITMMMFAYAFILVLPEYHNVLTVWFFLQAVELIDYFLTYNSPWFHIGSLGVSITFVKFVVLAILILWTWIKR